MTKASRSLTPIIAETIEEWVARGYGPWIIDRLLTHGVLRVVGPLTFTTAGLGDQPKGEPR